MSVFSNGGQWVKIDLHLHTKSDKEFKYFGDNFEGDFIDKLKEQGIKIAAITNHNKFNHDEFLRLRHLANENGIWLLPGVELSVNDGKEGIHVLVIFEDSEITEKDFVSEFITLCFEGRERFDCEGRPKPSAVNLEQLIEKLDKFGKEYLLIMAHVSNNKGLFKSFKIGRVVNLAERQLLREKIIAFQDINDYFRQKFEDGLRQRFKDEYRNHLPAYVSFSDPKKIGEIGKRETWIKIGEYDFKALKLAFLMHEIRIRKPKPPEYKHQRILEVEIEDGSFFGNTKITFNPELNSIIGVRGSGKSALIEVIRWALGYEAVSDKDYKEKLPKYGLGNVGKIKIKLVGNNGKIYVLKKEVETGAVHIEDQFGNDLGLTSLEGMFDLKYYGQHDLSYYGQNPRKLIELLDDFAGEELRKLKQKETEIMTEIKELVFKLKKLEQYQNELNDLQEEKTKIEEKIKVFEEKGVRDKLELQVSYERDDENIKILLEETEKIKTIVSTTKKELKDVFKRMLNLSFENFPDTWREKYETLQDELIRNIDQAISQVNSVKNDIESNELKQFKEKLIEIRRELDEIKKALNEKKIDTNYYMELVRKKEQIEHKVRELTDKIQTMNQLLAELDSQLERLGEVRDEIYRTRKSFADKINSSVEILRISLVRKGDKKGFEEFINKIFYGTGISGKKKQKIIELFEDGHSLYKAIKLESETLEQILTPNELNKLKEKIQNPDIWWELVTYEPSDIVRIEYRTETGEFKDITTLSIGQRATALLSLILLETNMPLIIDQPEDDLDNNTIYEAIIKKVLQKKEGQQFIFATHSPNIVVLGDTDNVIVCKNENEKFEHYQGSIDNKEIQRYIVNIMEGGREAFENRKRVYLNWET